MIEGSCHCGAVRFKYHPVPEYLNSCNCSLCRRVGGLWAYADPKDIEISYPPDGMVEYMQGDKCLATMSCKTCGCTTHWEPRNPPDYPRMAVNMAMADPKDLEGIRIRHFDGADTWEYLD